MSRRWRSYVIAFGVGVWGQLLAEWVHGEQIGFILSLMLLTTGAIMVGVLEWGFRKETWFTSLW